jgi:hypothetical protein
MSKANLLAAIAGTNRGILATETQNQTIQTAIAQLEAQTPTPRPLDHLDLLNGVWRLLYTTSAQLLGFEKWPFIQTGQIYQCIQAESLTLYNIAELQGLPGLEAIVGVFARLKPVSERRVEVHFERSITGLQRLLNYQSPQTLVRQLDTQQTVNALNIPLPTQRQTAWLETTYLDADLRIGRGSRDSVFVLSRV